MIKEFKCISSEHEPVMFEVRFLTYQHYCECLWSNNIHCPECGDGQKILPVISKTAKPQFRGTGFHETDYK